MIRSFWLTFGIGQGYPLRLCVGIVNPFTFRKHWYTIYPLKLVVRHQSWVVRLPLARRL